ncbi:hypothetical protein LPB140_05840 [Sphingorhabdus lutea]|uniref:Uncharacterized protein n=1 Tax=Sphingorhabdus lutea TaxID=1913578 RepID=A0A1L3JB84_9SPHN|nr:hypothetical protein LPB140_05840 [Sphingorhabdus lutea]
MTFISFAHNGTKQLKAVCSFFGQRAAFLFNKTINYLMYKGSYHEAHFSAEQPRAQAPSRFPQPHGYSRWPQNYCRSPQPWPQVTQRVSNKAPLKKYLSNLDESFFNNMNLGRTEYLLRPFSFWSFNAYALLTLSAVA